MGVTINDAAIMKTKWMAFAGSCICAIAFFVLGMVDTTFAESFIGSAANDLLGDLAKVVALVGLGAGIFQVVKGRTVMGIIIAVVAAVLYFFCKKPDILEAIGKSIYGILGIN